MRKFGSENLLSFDPEIERSCRRNRRERREAVRHSQETMGDTGGMRNENNPPPALRDYSLPTAVGLYSAIRRPTMAANNFEIKAVQMQMIQATQFNGLPSENPNAHIASFLEICNTFKYNGVTDEAIRLLLFPFTLKDRARDWLTSLPADSITTWEDLVHKFLAKFFPPAKTAKLRIEINNFAQHDGETLYEAWERYKELLRKCPHHGLPKWMIVHNIYNGLNGTSRIVIDASAGGSFMKKSEEEAYELLDDVATNNFQWPSERVAAKKATGVYEIDALTALTAQVASLTKHTTTECGYHDGASTTVI